MTLDRPCDRCNAPEADVGWDNEVLCLPCFITDLHGRQLAAQAAIARRRQGDRNHTPWTFEPEPTVYRAERAHTYHRPGPKVYGDSSFQTACGKAKLAQAVDTADEATMAQRARPCSLCFSHADIRHRNLLAVGAPA